MNKGFSKSRFSDNLHRSLSSKRHELAYCAFFSQVKIWDKLLHKKIKGDRELHYAQLKITTFPYLSTKYNIKSVPLRPLWPQIFPSVHSFLFYCVCACSHTGCGYYMPWKTFLLYNTIILIHSCIYLFSHRILLSAHISLTMTAGFYRGCGW